jgi:hypothetical protein
MLTAHGHLTPRGQIFGRHMAYDKAGAVGIRNAL